VTADVKARNHGSTCFSGGAYWSEKKMKNCGMFVGFNNEKVLRFSTASHAIRGIPTVFWRVCRGLSRPWKTPPFVEVEAL
jgi:hypothetical protein